MSPDNLAISFLPFIYTIHYVDYSQFHLPLFPCICFVIVKFTMWYFNVSPGNFNLSHSDSFFGSIFVDIVYFSFERLILHNISKVGKFLYLFDLQVSNSYLAFGLLLSSYNIIYEINAAIIQYASDNTLQTHRKDRG